ncbi:E3 ubiquitin-protein ligase TRIM45-like [Saccostrea cucullata]|uniref:E3 ubiquitin-protein ligase TRIM45-like n=1 Tax=Saccostrea cuccullata TaxID=36930 RepID=UPI002ECFC645
MNPRTSAQEILDCDLCQTAALQSHCELCQINLCKACVGEHLSVVVVQYKHRKFTPTIKYPKCPNHTQRQCKLYCEKCDAPACSTCISSKHDGHYISDVLKKLNSKTEDLKRDFIELEQRIYPTYKEIESDLQSEKLNLEAQYETLITTVTEHGEI